MTPSLRFACLLVVSLALDLPARAEGPRPSTRNVILVTTDGLRWQEVFRGADAALLSKKDGGVADPDALRRDYWRDSPEARREALMPFLWTTVARQGQVFGNRDRKSLAQVTNGKNFSYPGYNLYFLGGCIHHAAKLRGYPGMFGRRKLLPDQEASKTRRRRSMPRCEKPIPPT